MKQIVQMERIDMLGGSSDEDEHFDFATGFANAREAAGNAYYERDDETPEQKRAAEKALREQEEWRRGVFERAFKNTYSYQELKAQGAVDPFQRHPKTGDYVHQRFADFWQGWQWAKRDHWY